MTAAAAAAEDTLDARISDQLLSPLDRPKRALDLALLFTGAGALLLFAGAGYTVLAGIGVWGNNIPVGWGFGIINFVWWIGIGHAGTFISAILLLLEQPWRTALSRIAEAMTLFALVQAAMFPLLHLGRPWFFYWLVPYPSTLQVWPQFMSALTWDIAAVFTYSLVSLLFWYLGLIPDLATARDRARTARRRKAYAFFALGFTGSAVQWQSHKRAQLLLAGLATPLVLSVHSIVSMDFAMSKLAGWHSTIFPPYFVAGAIFSGFAMVVTVVVPLRRYFGLEQVITERHLDLMGKMVLLTGLIVSYSYLVEHFSAWLSGDEFERHMMLVTRPLGPYAWAFWVMIACNVGVPQLLWWRRVRTSALGLLAVSLLVQVGMWFERFVLIVTSQHQDFLPSSWDMFTPSLVDGALLIGTVCFFSFLLLLMVKFVPFVPIAEAKEEQHHEHRRRNRSGAEQGGRSLAAGTGEG